MRGGEKVLEVLCELFPDAELFTLVHVPGAVSPTIERRRDHTSFVQRLPRAPAVLPPLPAALPDRGRAVRPRRLRPGRQHEPLRGQIGGRARPGAAHLLLPHADAVRLGSVRRVFRRRSGWDGCGSWRHAAASWRGWRAGTRATAGRVRPLSWRIRSMLRGRIRRYYNREASVVYPPVDTTFLPVQTAAAPEHYLLIVSALVPYKRMDIAIEACAACRRCRCASSATAPTARGSRRWPARSGVSRAARRTRRCATLYRAPRPCSCPAKRISASCRSRRRRAGGPVVALARGGALETVIDGETGVLVDEPTPEALADGLRRVAATGVRPGAHPRARGRFSPRALRRARCRRSSTRRWRAPPGTPMVKRHNRLLVAFYVVSDALLGMGRSCWPTWSGSRAA